MFHNVNLDKLNLHGFNERIKALSTKRNNSETKANIITDINKFRMTQRLVKPNNKKIKS